MPISKVKSPRLSVNKLGEYMASRPGRQNKILHDAKYPQDFIVAYYREAQEAIAASIANGLEDTANLERMIKLLGSRNPETVYETRRLSGNIDAMETFMDLVGDVNLKGATAKLGAHQAESIVLHGVEISVRPEITLHATKRGGEPLVGGIKLHFPKTYPLPAEAAEYISACLQIFCRDNLQAAGAPSHAHCFVIDMAGAKVFDGAKAIKSRMRDVEEACRQIASIWPGI